LHTDGVSIVSLKVLVYIAHFTITVKARVDLASLGALSQREVDSCGGMNINKVTKTLMNRELIYLQ
jgi:hypothetical protein